MDTVTPVRTDLSVEFSNQMKNDSHTPGVVCSNASARGKTADGAAAISRRRLFMQTPVSPAVSGLLIENKPVTPTQAKQL